jgi:hypothetical protein
MGLAALIIAILALIIAVGGVALTWYVYRVAKKLDERNHLILAVMCNAFNELVSDDEAMIRIFKPLEHTNYIITMNRASGLRYFQVTNKKGEVILGTMGIGQVGEVPPTPIDIKWE